MLDRYQLRLITTHVDPFIRRPEAHRLQAHLSTARRRPMDPTARIWPMVVAATSKQGKKKTRKYIRPKLTLGY